MKSRALMAGIMIGFAAILSCAISNPILAAGFFSLGLLYIRMNGWYLYTGQIQNLALKKTTFKELIWGLLCNIYGVTIIILPVIFLDNPDFFAKFEAVQQAKWIHPWYHYIASGAFCGILMTIATKKDAPLWISSACVMAFILAGFNHCIADWFYIIVGGYKYFFLWLCTVFGNFIGGYLVAPRNYG